MPTLSESDHQSIDINAEYMPSEWERKGQQIENLYSVSEPQTERIIISIALVSFRLIEID